MKKKNEDNFFLVSTLNVIFLHLNTKSKKTSSAKDSSERQLSNWTQFRSIWQKSIIRAAGVEPATN